MDTGLGLMDCESHARLPGWFRAITRPRLDPEESAVRQIERLGYKRRDVRHIVLTHLDRDHAGGVPDFPDALIHVLADEHDATFHPRTFREVGRSLGKLWNYNPNWVLHRASGERWFGFEHVQLLIGSESDVLLVPLPGHTRGHAGIAVKTSTGWLLHAGDSYMSHGELERAGAAPPGLLAWEHMLAVDSPTVRVNQQRLRELARDHASEVRIFSSHCAVEFARFHPGHAGAGRLAPAHV